MTDWLSRLIDWADRWDQDDAIFGRSATFLFFLLFLNIRKRDSPNVWRGGWCRRFQRLCAGRVWTVIGVPARDVLLRVLHNLCPDGVSYNKALCIILIVIIFILTIILLLIFINISQPDEFGRSQGEVFQTTSRDAGRTDLVGLRSQIIYAWSFLLFFALFLKAGL